MPYCVDASAASTAGARHTRVNPYPLLRAFTGLTRLSPRIKYAREAVIRMSWVAYAAAVEKQKRRAQCVSSQGCNTTIPTNPISLRGQSCIAEPSALRSFCCCAPFVRERHPQRRMTHPRRRRWTRKCTPARPATARRARDATTITFRVSRASPPNTCSIS
ncbi:hypothetical protein BCAR13_840017 [Paraburkholderia caribensis]|nr:hypothetical protein BCAR13_840017 [Paraburkholderia caribensis]